MEPDREQRQEETENAKGRRREGGDEDRRRRRSLTGDPELSRSLNAAIQDEDAADDR